MATALQRKFWALQKTKTKYCKGKTTKSAVAKAAAAYIKAAVAKGQTRTEATKKANRVRRGGCKMSSVAGTKKRKTTKRRKTTRRKRRA